MIKDILKKTPLYRPLKYIKDTFQNKQCEDEHQVVLTREEKILFHIDKEKDGLEFGPSHRPIAPKKEGYRCKVFDHCSEEALKEKYKEHGVNIENIEEVDYIWNGEKISELVTEQVDWIIASHMIEHTTDFVGFLQECEKILHSDGILSLAIPDKNRCFDYERELTSLGQVIDAIGDTNHTVGAVMEYHMCVVKNDGKIAWDDNIIGNIQRVHTAQDALNAKATIESGEYVDIHAWVFTLKSFQRLIEDLKSLGFISFEILDVGETMGHEFYVTLKKAIDPSL